MTVLDNVTVMGKKIPLIPILALLAVVLIIAVVGQSAIFGEATVSIRVTNQQTNEAVVGLSLTVGDQNLVTDQNGFARTTMGLNQTKKITIRDPEFEDYQQNVIATANPTFLAIKLKPRAQAQTFNVTFVQSNGKKIPDGHQIQVQWECTKSGETKTADVNNARISISKQPTCGRLILKASSTGYLSQSGIEIAEDTTIRFTEIYTPKGKLVVNVQDSKTKQAPSANFMILVYDTQEALIEQKILNRNQAKFETLPVGKYLVQAVDENKYAMSGLIPVDINKNRSTSLVIKVSSEPQSTLNVHVQDETGKAIGNARVVAAQKLTYSILGEALTDSTGDTTLAFEETQNIELTTIANGYAWNHQSISLKSGENQATVVLESCQVAKRNCGVIRVIVVDEEGQKASNVRVTLFDAVTNTLAFPNSRFTDENGTSLFDNVPAGFYYVRASKDERTFTQGDSFQFDPTGEHTEIIVLNVIKLPVQLDVVDTLQESIANARITIHINGQSDCKPLNSCGFTTDESGTYQFQLRGDQSFYFTVEKEGYLTYESPEYEAYEVPNPLRVVVTMKRPDEVTGEAPQITLLEIRDETGRTTRKLHRGKTYRALFEITFPQDGTKEVFIRTGNATDVFNDPIEILSASAGSGFFIGGQTYRPYKSESLDRAETVNSQDGYKWADISWTNTAAAVVHVEALLHVMEDTLPNTEMSVYYRAQNNNGIATLRDPVDEVLQNEASNPQRDGMYANSHGELFYEGTASGGENGLGFCSEELCLEKRMVKVNGEPVPEADTYMIRTGQTNQITWTIVNNTADTLHDLNMVVQNALGGDSSNTYYITHAKFETAEKTADVSNVGFGNPKASIPFLESGQRATVFVEFIALDAVDSPVSVQALTREGSVLEDDAFFETDSRNQLDVETDVSELPLLTRTEVNTHVEDQENREVGQALTSLVINDQVQQQFLTSDEGDVLLTIPPVSPTAKVKIRAEKNAFIPGEKNFTVSNDIFRIEPTPIEVELDQVVNREQTISLQITNESGQTFLVTGFDKTGNNRAILDEEKMVQALISHVGDTILTPGEVQTFEIPFALDRDVRFRTSQNTNGVLVLDLLDREFTNHYQLVVPFKVHVSLGQPLDDDKCLKVNPKSWRATTVEGFAKTSFEISNECVSGSTAVTIQNLEARVKWNSEIMGNVVAEVKTRAGTKREIVKNSYTVLSPRLEANEVAQVELSFIPLNGKIGKKATFDVGFNGQVAREGSIVEIGPDTDVNSLIFIANLEQCVIFDPKPNPGLFIDGDDEFGTFEVSTENCGPIPIDFKFCSEENNANCSGGTEGGIGLSQWDINALKEDKQKVEVSRWPDERTQIAGQYGVTLQVKTPNSDWKSIGEYAVIVKPDTKQPENPGLGKPYYFYLNRYNVFLPDYNSQDAVTLYNTQLAEAVEVEACHTAWMEAAESEFFTGAGLQAGIGTVAIAGAATWFAASGGYATATLTPYVGVSQYVFPYGSTGGAGTSFVTPGNPSALGGLITPGAIFNLGATMVIGAVSTMIGNLIAQAIGGTAGAVVGGVVTGALTLGLTLLLGLCATIVLCILGAVLAAVSVLVTALGSEPPDCIPITSTLSAYVINFTGAGGGPSDAPLILSDAKSVTTDLEKIKADWETGITDFYTDTSQVGPTQEVGVVFKRLSADTLRNPTYTTLTVQATEHFHGENPNHVEGMSKVDCGKEGDFGVFNIPCDETMGTRTEKFHVRVKTIESLDKFIQPETNAIACVSGSRYGSTGKEANPHIKLNWSWRDGEGIEWNTCDASNPNAVYCDATQFSIMTMKRIQALDEVFAANNYLSGVCPSEEKDDYEKDVFVFGMKSDGNMTNLAGQDQNDLNAGVIFLQKRWSNNQLVFAAKAVNRTLQNANFIFTVDVMDTQFKKYATCQFDPFILGPSEETVGECTLSVTLEPRFYLARGMTTAGPENQASLIDQNIFTGFNVLPQDPGIVGGYTNCDTLRTTEIKLGFPVMRRFFDLKEPFIGTIKAPTIQKTMELMHFDAYLQKDSFSKDFIADFVERYTAKETIDTPAWFADRNKLGDLMREGRVVFTNRYYIDSKVASPGKYRVSINVVYGNEWKLFTSSEGEKPFITVSIYPIEDATDESLFYYLPINGMVGEQNEAFNREGYGTDYNTPGRFKFQNILTSAITLPSDQNSQPLQSAVIINENNFGKLNAQAESRGNLLSITRNTDGGYDWVVSPTLATPIMMRVDESQKKTNARAFYQVLQDQQPFSENDVFGLWTASGQCLDFSGQNAIQVFDQTADRKITNRDGFPSTPQGYAIDWPVVDRTGSEWLKTIIYTPLGHNYAIQGISANTSFSAPENAVTGKSVGLGGIVGMNHNYQGLTTDQTPQTLQAIFDLVESGDVCVTRTANSEEYWWNPESLYNKAGRGTSVRATEENFVAGQTCVG